MFAFTKDCLLSEQDFVFNQRHLVFEPFVDYSQSGRLLRCYGLSTSEIVVALVLTIVLLNNRQSLIFTLLELMIPCTEQKYLSFIFLLGVFLQFFLSHRFDFFSLASFFIFPFLIKFVKRLKIFEIIDGTLFDSQLLPKMLNLVLDFLFDLY